MWFWCNSFTIWVFTFSIARHRQSIVTGLDPQEKTVEPMVLNVKLYFQKLTKIPHHWKESRVLIERYNHFYFTIFKSYEINIKHFCKLKVILIVTRAVPAVPRHRAQTLKGRRNDQTRTKFWVMHNSIINV